LDALDWKRDKGDPVTLKVVTQNFTINYSA